jgi:hypothetical protein
MKLELAYETLVILIHYVIIILDLIGKQVIVSDHVGLLLNIIVMREVLR